MSDDPCPIPKFLSSHYEEWIKLDPPYSDDQPARASTFAKALHPGSVHLHSTPSNVPDLNAWTIIRKLHVPASTKSFLLKLYMNALPTADRIKFGGSKVSCPACNEDLTGDHFFSSTDCLKKYTSKIYQWCDKHWLPRPECLVNFDNRFSLKREE